MFSLSSVASRVQAPLAGHRRSAQPRAARGANKLAVQANSFADFTGTWSKVKHANMEKFLVLHGHKADAAAAMADAPYRQTWEFVEEDDEGSVWKVVTHREGGDRELVYPLGEWEEKVTGPSQLFGDETESVTRNTHWEEHPYYGWMHITESQTPLGWEETKRFVSEGQMFCQRMFFPLNKQGVAGEPVSAVQVFDRE